MRTTLVLVINCVASSAYAQSSAPPENTILGLPPLAFVGIVAVGLLVVVFGGASLLMQMGKNASERDDSSPAEANTGFPFAFRTLRKTENTWAVMRWTKGAMLTGALFAGFGLFTLFAVPSDPVPAIFTAVVGLIVFGFFQTLHGNREQRTIRRVWWVFFIPVFTLRRKVGQTFLKRAKVKNRQDGQNWGSSNVMRLMSDDGLIVQWGAKERGVASEAKRFGKFVTGGKKSEQEKQAENDLAANDSEGEW